MKCVAIILAAAALAGCGEERGYVDAAHFEAAKQMCAGSGGLQEARTTRILPNRWGQGAQVLVQGVCTNGDVFQRSVQ